MNHLPIDNDYNVYSKISHSVKQSVNSEKTASSKTGSKKTDYSAIYTKEFKEDSLDPHCQALIKGQLGRKKKKAPVSRIETLDLIKTHMEENMKYFMLGQDEKVKKADIWHQKGYYSTDCGEENDEKEKKAEEEDEEEEYYYDEEEEDEQEESKEETPEAKI